MSNIVKGRMTAELDREIVVFLIGMRINKLWKVHQWWPVAMAMPRMIRELSTQPELGFLHAEQWFGRTTIMVQYWQSFDHLETYAKNRDHVHLPDGPHSIGTLVTMEMLVYGTKPIAYHLSPGSFETFYGNMPPFGMARATRLVEASGRRNSARERLLT